MTAVPMTAVPITPNEVLSEDACPAPALGPALIAGRIEEWHRAMAGQSAAEQSKAHLLSLTLMTGVPLAAHDIRQSGGPSEEDQTWCHQFALRLGSQADRLQFLSPRGEWTGEGKHRHYQWSTADLMTQMIRGVAILSFLPGGVTVFGLHFESNPDKEGMPSQ